MDTSTTSSNRLDEIRQNKQDQFGLSPVAGYAPKMREAIDTVSDQYYRGQDFIILGEIHTNGDITHQLGLDLAKRHGKAFATEIISPASQPYIDAFAAGKMTRAEFMDLCPDFYTYEKDQIPSNGHPQHYMGHDRGRQLYHAIADAIESGVPVYGAGSLKSFLGQNETPELEAIAQKALHMSSQIRVETFLKIKEVHGSVHVDRLEREMKAHENYGEYMSLKNSFLQQTKDTGVDDLGKNFSMKRRLSGDPETASLLEDVVKKHPKGVVVSYGMAHTAHNRFWGTDIDQSLRDRGMDVLIIDPVLDRSPPCNRLFLDNDKAAKEICDTGSDDKGSKSKAFQESFAVDSFDPDRVVANLDTGEVYRADPLLDFGRKAIDLLTSPMR